jgi:hypothetical protein
MSKTFKTSAAWYAHHTIPKQTSLREHSHKRKVSQEDVPEHLREMVEIIDKNWVAIRSGNSRKADALGKKHLRRKDRLLDKQATHIQLSDIN